MKVYNGSFKIKAVMHYLTTIGCSTFDIGTCIVVGYEFNKEKKNKIKIKT